MYAITGNGLWVSPKGGWESEIARAGLWPTVRAASEMISLERKQLGNGILPEIAGAIRSAKIVPVSAAFGSDFGIAE